MHRDQRTAASLRPPLVIRDLWSPDLNPPSEGLPPDLRDFEVFVQVAITDQSSGVEVFGFNVCSRSRILVGSFVTQTLVLDEFSWPRLREALEPVLEIASRAGDWDQAIERLASVLHAQDHQERLVSSFIWPRPKVGDEGGGR
jgi:hypothetical protein